jgi:hypothetical protein
VSGTSSRTARALDPRVRLVDFVDLVELVVLVVGILLERRRGRIFRPAPSLLDFQARDVVPLTHDGHEL